MVFGSGNKFRIRRSQSKASYLTARRDRDRIIPESDTGSYKRTMSPNGHALPPEPVINDTQKARETLWPSHRPSKNHCILRRASMNENKIEKCDEKEDLKKNLVLPDVLPVNVKLMGPRSQYNRPSQMSLVSDNNPNINSLKSPMKSPPSSPPKSPSGNSPLTPLRTATFSTTPPSSNMVTSSPITTLPSSRFSISSVGSTSSIRALPATLPRAHVSPSRESKTIVTPPTSPKRTSPGTPKSPRRNSPPIKPTLSPSSTLKLSPVKITMSPTTTLPPSPLPSTSSPNTPLSSSSPPPLTSTLVLKEDYPQVIEGLQLIQRTEVVLRVNATTTDASSQTEKEELPPTPLPTRKKLKEEIEYEKLAEDLIDHLPSSDRLKELLVPLPEHKKPSDYVQGLFRVDITSRPRPLNSPFRSKNNTPSSTPPPTLTLPVNSLTTTAVSPATSRFSLSLSSPTSPTSPPVEPTSPLSGSSTYFTTSEPKARFLTRYSQDMKNCHIVKNTKDLSQKKEELVSRLDKKLEVLRSEQLIVGDECKINDELGENVEVHINRVARPYEVAKFRLHVEEIGKITSLLLSLSGRLARAENALMGMSDDDPERRILEAKRDKLLDQLEEAKKLKESIDRRSVNVSNILYKYLNSEEYADYDHFINMKAKLLMDSKEISDKIKLGEEQLLALKETLIFTD